VRSDGCAGDGGAGVYEEASPFSLLGASTGTKQPSKKKCLRLCPPSIPLQSLPSSQSIDPALWQTQERRTQRVTSPHARPLISGLRLPTTKVLGARTGRLQTSTNADNVSLSGAQRWRGSTRCALGSVPQPRLRLQEFQEFPIDH